VGRERGGRGEGRERGGEWGLREGRAEWVRVDYLAVH
jgi:hypothetical protein